ncbi:hypothetical protein DPMN_113400 [Dreissena polymorpha]|uniref:Uncharacterized protein n=1 Tax=Dreissena polymorpha TaxID=45954 RepID=A0A9D4KHE0_DREPO|nr:hypothetical protein DPMN_113400 [Dreissena polymorpha]
MVSQPSGLGFTVLPLRLTEAVFAARDCERLYRPLDRGADWNRGVTRNRSLSKQADVGFKRKKRDCYVCGAMARCIRYYVETRHFPPLFHREAWANPEIDPARYSGLICLINNLDLQRFREAMRVVRRFIFYIHLPVFHVARINSRALLLHWKVLAELPRLCNQEFRETFWPKGLTGVAAWSSATGPTQEANLMQRPGPDCCLVVKATVSARETDLIQRPRSD